MFTETSTANSGLVLQAEYARMRGFSRQYVYKLVTRGKIKLKDGKVPVEEADRLLQLSADPARQMVKAEKENKIAAAPPLDEDESVSDPTFTQYRTEREKHAAAMAELQYKEKIGELVRKKDVEHDVFGAFRTLRDSLLNLPATMSLELSNMSSEREIRQLIEDRINQVLTEAGDKIAGAAVEVVMEAGNA